MVTNIKLLIVGMQLRNKKRNMQRERDAQILEETERLARLLDTQFGIPGTNFGFGIDALIGLIPVAGDTAGLIFSFVILFQGLRMRLPPTAIFAMFFNIFIDWLIGLIPIAGDLFDFAFKANHRNAQIMRRHFERRYG